MKKVILKKYFILIFLISLSVSSYGMTVSKILNGFNEDQLNNKEIFKEKIFYVSPEGNDNNKGTIEQPFKTLERAKLAITDNANYTIYLRNGYYSLEKTFELDKSNIAKNTKVIIASYPGERAHITGGKKISGFKKLDESRIDYQRINSKFRKNILMINLKEQGITKYGSLSARGFGREIQASGLELFFNNEQMTLARWPNKDWTTIKDIPKSLGEKGFKYHGDRPEKWINATDIWLHGYWKYDWSDTYVKIDKIDIRKKTITTEAPYSNYPFTKGKRFYALNLLEELDAPGEWYLNRESGILYFWPPTDIRQAEVFVSLLQDPLVRLDHVKNITFKDLIFEYTSGAGIEITGGDSNMIDACVLRNIGTVAVSIGKLAPDLGSLIYKNTLYNGDAGHNNGIVNCEINATGEGGIILGGGDRVTLKPGNNYAISNNIYDCSRWVRTYRAGIFMYGVGNIVKHNLIHDLPHTALFFWGNEHLMEYNEIYRVCMETGDAGAFYNGRDWTQRGSVIRYNYFHDLHGVEGQSGWNEVMAIYLDDWSSGATIFGNVFYKAGRTVMIGGGRDNLVENNVIIDGNPAIHVDSRGMGWASTYFDGSNNTLFERLNAIDPDHPPYSVAYPDLAGIPKNQPALPKGNRIIKNISSGGNWKELLNKETEPLVFFKDNRINIDRKYLLSKDNRIDIQYDSIEIPQGFQRIPFEMIGLNKVGK